MKNKDYHIIESVCKDYAYKNGIKKVLIALSGGADSVATAFALQKIGLMVSALHCNFHLRGEESERDQKFVERFCNKNDIPLQVIHFNVEEYIASHKGVSLEMACRKLRYDWFEEELKKSGADRVATGHNADDNIETFFLNMLRGSGSKGLKGISADNKKIWRPLLSFHRKEIVEYLNSNQLEFVVDSTNLSSDYRRNFLRNEIIPKLKQEWHGFEKAMKRTIDNLSEENKIIESSVTQTILRFKDGMPCEIITDFPAPLLLLKRFIEEAGPYVNTHEEILASINAKKPHIRRWRLKNGEVFIRNNVLFVKVSHGKSRP